MCKKFNFGHILVGLSLLLTIIGFIFAGFYGVVGNNFNFIPFGVSIIAVGISLLFSQINAQKTDKMYALLENINEQLDNIKNK